MAGEREKTSVGAMAQATFSCTFGAIHLVINRPRAGSKGLGAAHRRSARPYEEDGSRGARVPSTSPSTGSGTALRQAQGPLRDHPSTGPSTGHSTGSGTALRQAQGPLRDHPSTGSGTTGAALFYGFRISRRPSGKVSPVNMQFKSSSLL